MKKWCIILILTISKSVSAQDTAHIGLSLATLTSTEKVYNFYAWNYHYIIASQYSMIYDSAKMTYQGIRNSIVSGLGEGTFGHPLPGVITSLWLDLDLEAEDYADSVVLYQIAFDVIQPDGSSLCFSDTPLEYEFVSYHNDIDQALDELYIKDDCLPETLVIINPTATNDPAASAIHLIEHVSLSSSGTLAFTSVNGQSISLSLHDMTGKSITSFPEKSYAEGRHILSCSPVITGIYFLKALGANGSAQVMKVFAY